jgi:hypothetical protein
LLGGALGAGGIAAMTTPAGRAALKAAGKMPNLQKHAVLRKILEMKKHHKAVPYVVGGAIGGGALGLHGADEGLGLDVVENEAKSKRLREKYRLMGV